MRLPRTLQDARRSALQICPPTLVSRALSLALALSLFGTAATPVAAEPSPAPTASGAPTSAPTAAPSPVPSAAPSPATAPSKKSGESAASIRLQLTQAYDEVGMLAWTVFLGASGGKKSDGMIREAASALDDSTSRLTRLYGQIYGDRAGSDLATAWKRQNTAIVECARAIARGDATARDAARKTLVEGVSGTLGGALAAVSNQPREALAAAFTEYLQNLIAAADGQAAHDFNIAYRNLDGACGALGRVAETQAEAAVRAFPARFAGSPTLPATELRVRLCSLVGQQLFTLALANRANISSNIDEYYALLARSDLFTTRIGTALTPYGGTDFSTRFTTLWKKYIASLQDYEKAREAKDNQMAKRIKGDLNGHATELVTLLVPPPPTRAVPPPRKGGKKPKAPPAPPLLKDVQAFIDANLDIIDDETKGRDPFGAIRRGWSETRSFTEAVSNQILTRFGTTPQPSDVPSGGSGPSGATQ